MEDRSKITLDVTPKHASIGVACGLVYTTLVFFAGYFIGQRKAFGDIIKNVGSDQAKMVGLITTDENHIRACSEYHLVNRSCAISLGYFAQPEQAYEVADWANKTVDLTFRVCEQEKNIAVSESSSMIDDLNIYHVFSESCSSEAAEQALQTFAHYSDRSECKQLRLI